MIMRAIMGPNGFGNEFVKLAKLLVCRKELGVPLAASYWRSPYRRAVPRELCHASRLRKAWRIGSDRLRWRRLSFGIVEHAATGLTAVEAAFASYLKSSGIGLEDRVLVEFKGLSPGIETVEKHGSYLFDTLMSVKGNAGLVQERMRLLEPSGCLRVGVHIRRGDFRAELPPGEAWPRGKWNIRIPLEWYAAACTQIRVAFHDRVHFFVTANACDPAVDDFCKRFRATVSMSDPYRREEHDVADLLTLASCDTLVASASSFSVWAAVLQPKPWLWYTPAHGMPRVAQDTASLYAGTGELPTPYMNALEDRLCRLTQT